MKQETISKVLKTLAVIIGMMGIVFFLVGIPYMIDFIIEYNSEVRFLRYPAMIGFGIIAIICYYALYQFYTICREIGYLNSFCKENVLALRNIALAAVMVGTVIFIGDIYLLIVGWLHPSLAICSLFFIFVAIAFSVVCFSLSSLLSNAVTIKRENDLTI